jgi:hypothetical protein
MSFSGGVEVGVAHVALSDCIAGAEPAELLDLLGHGHGYILKI